MVENVQCPVCTLFLHAGMNLSDHLETHPKEQVIKALVQMTITGGVVSGALAAACAIDKKVEVDAKTPEKEQDLSSNSASNSSLSLGSTTCSSNNSLNFARTFPPTTTTATTTTTAVTPQKQPTATEAITSPTSTGNGGNVVGGTNIFNQQQTATATKAYQRSGSNASSSATAAAAVVLVNGLNAERPGMPTDFSAFAANRYQQPPQQQHASTSQLQQQQSSQQHVSVAHQHRATLPPPPPPLPSQPTTQPATSFQMIQQPHALHPATTAHRHQQLSQHHHQQQKQQQQPQTLKNIYSSALPPPPPLQLFTYQPQPQPQHQKPPPAYGTAISQIRSQHQNQNKQAAMPAQHMRVALPPVEAPASKHLFQDKQIELPPPPPPPPATPPASATHHHKYLNEAAPQSHNHHEHYVSHISNAATTNNNKPSNIVAAQSPPPSTTSQTQSLSVATPSASSSSGSNNRQTNSPFSTLLAAAAQSPSSVLRYAESPVAHYLERDNGDFIVQETPKHIVECVEKDNGEFSVIERIYQSPPSVLHIHDDDEDEDDEEEEQKPDDSAAHPPIVENCKNATVAASAPTDEDEEEFMSITSESEEDDVVIEKFKKDEGRKPLDEATNLNAEPATSTAAVSGTPSAVNFSGGSNTNTTANSTSSIGTATRKKSSKNTITVLSDVQLNLNEYLDLVGNIIASSKIAAQRTAFGVAAAPIPLLKVEKVEPPDEYDMQDQQELDSQSDEDPHNGSEEAAAVVVATTEPPTPIANKNETEELVENNCNNKTSLNENDEKPTIGRQEGCRELHAATEQQVVASTCSSQVTSVIRMATTSQQQQQPQQQHQPSAENLEYLGFIFPHTQHLTAAANHNKELLRREESVAEDLSQPQLKMEPQEQQQHQHLNVVEESLLPQKSIPPPPPLKKGPKKLVIKPKSTKTDGNANRSAAAPEKVPSSSSCNTSVAIFDDHDQPSTSAMAQMQLSGKNYDRQLHDTAQMSQKLVIKSELKSEPSQCSYESSGSILEQHLKLGAHQIECKKEQPFLTESHTHMHHDKIESRSQMKVEKECHEIVVLQSNENVADDARVLLDFANSKKHIAGAASTSASATFLSSSSIFSNAIAATAASETSTTAAASTHSLRCDDEFILPDGSDVVQEIVISSSYSSQSASDVALKHTTTSSANVAANEEQQHQQQQHTFTDYPFSFLYGGGNVAQQVETNGSFSPLYQQAHDATTAATLASGSNSATIEDSTSAHASHQQQPNRFGTAAQSAVSQWYHHTASAANSDFEAAFAVDCSAAVDGDVSKYLDLDACKHESIVGLQVARSSTSSSFTAATESSLAGGCTTDALNIRTDEKMPAKGEISEQESNCDIENSWSQPMYGDISARFFKTSFPGIFQQENGWNHDEYFSVQDLSASTTATTSTDNRPTKSFDFRLPLEATTSATAIGNTSNNLQLFPQHHADAIPSTSANKKKRKRDINNDNATITRVQPTATITSQQLLLHHMQTLQQYPHQPHIQLQQQQQQHNQPTTSAALLAGPSTAAAASAALQQKARKKIYQCAHCTAEFPKLKDRNSHMIAEHNYVRQNRRLICSATTTSASTTTATITTADLAAAGTSSANILMQSGEIVEDSKQGIVKIEMDNLEQPLAMTINEGIDAKTELIDEKDSLALVPANGSAAISAAAGDEAKSNLHLLSISTPATKLATLYRMLVSYNISTLKQHQNLTEFEEKLIETSIFFCYVCRRNFSSVKLYDAHLTEHPAECFTCGKKFQRWKNFSLHLKRHLGWKEFGCNVCDKKFVVRSALVEHMRMHTGQTPLKCKICGKNFKRYSNLTQHRKRHGKQIIRKKEYVCHCGEVLPSKARFLWHKETHDSKPKCCPHCCDRFVHANSLRRHIRLAHSDKFDYTEPMECPMCKHIFAKSSIKAHMATHSMDTQHDCPICNKSFSTKWNLKIHSWVHANRTAKPFKCEHCPKAFVREVDFKNHMNAHKQIKPYTCEYCGCKFIRKYNYMRHRREHHGHKKFTCDLCKKTFHRHYYLIEHRRIHTGERPFQCTICGKSSTTKTNHNKHLKIHHSRDPFTVEA